MPCPPAPASPPSSPRPAAPLPHPSNDCIARHGTHMPPPPGAARALATRRHPPPAVNAGSPAFTPPSLGEPAPTHNFFLPPRKPPSRCKPHLNYLTGNRG